jgi:hypothetical protein
VVVNNREEVSGGDGGDDVRGADNTVRDSGDDVREGGGGGSGSDNVREGGDYVRKGGGGVFLVPVVFLLYGVYVSFSLSFHSFDNIRSPRIYICIYRPDTHTHTYIYI